MNRSEELDIKIGTVLYDGGMPEGGHSVTEITDEGFYCGEYFFSWDRPDFCQINKS